MPSAGARGSVTADVDPALTTDQQAQYEELKGDPVEIDMQQLRGGFGRGGGFGGRGRGDRDRDRDNDGGDNDRGA